MAETGKSEDREGAFSLHVGAQCRSCGYSIEHLPERRCPECFTAFDLRDPTTFRLPGHRTEVALPWLLLCFCICASAFSVVVRDDNIYLWLLASVLQATVVVVACRRVRRSRSVAAGLYWLSLV